MFSFRMVCSYLVHHGYVGAAEAFAKSTGQDIDEDWTNIRNRQAIQKLVLAGKMGEAIQLTDRLYPGFLQSHPALHFMLKVHCSRSFSLPYSFEYNVRIVFFFSPKNCEY